ncbi:penicillin-binding protein 2 [bacterium]|nr:penicillin-binding protein 2 [bacterium]
MSFYIYRHNRERILKGIIIFLFIILSVRFFQLQVLSGSIYEAWSDRNRVRQVSVAANRGLIFDRYNRILVDNRPSYSLFVIPYELNKHPEMVERISSITGLSDQDIKERILQAGTGLFTPLRIMRDVDFETLSKIEESRLDLPGVFYQHEPVRTYPTDIRASHLIGYLSEINESELNVLNGNGYKMGDMIGKTGVEKWYDSILRGERGYQYHEVDVHGREVGNFNGKRDIQPISGTNIRLGLDMDLQRLAEDLLNDQKGAIIVLDPQNGEILTMVSKPDYSLEPFARGLSKKAWDNLSSDPDKPLLNRTIQAQLPPGSTYKLVTAASALEAGLIDTQKELFCGGTFWLGTRMFPCWRPEGHGSINILDAIRESCNVFFYQLGLQVGVDRWVRLSSYLGFGRITQIDLDGENEGLLPNRNYLDEKYGRGLWGKGMVVNLSIGQGDLLVTPMQMAILATIIGMEGKYPTPHVVQAIQDRSGNWNKEPIQMNHVNGISKPVFQQLKEGMWQVVNQLGGTGRAAWSSDIEICGKTGTAQNPHGEDHAWFIGFAPLDNPAIVIALVVENGGSGGGVAAPIAGEIIRRFFRKSVIL